MTYTAILDVRQSDLDRLLAAGCAPVLLHARDKRPIGENWQNSRVTPSRAAAHLRSNGNVGILTGKPSDGIVAIDLDRDAGEFISMFPTLRATLQSYRVDAPDRRKFFLRMDDDNGVMKTPASTSWKHDGATSPDVELLATGRQAAVIGQHPDGAEYKLTGHTIISVTFGQLSAIWRKWTAHLATTYGGIGAELRDPCAPRAEPRPEPRPHPHPMPRAEHAAPSRVDLAKAAWTPLQVFQHHGRAGELQNERNAAGYTLRLLGNGGLVINLDAGRWHCFSENVGGDAIDAWCYCTTGRTAPTGDEFNDTISAMLAAAGIAEPGKTVTVLWHGEPLELPVDAAFASLRQKFAATASYADLATVSRDRVVMLTLLATMESVGRTERVKLDVRTCAERSNMTALTASKALRSLARQGFIMRSNDPSAWFDGELDEDDRHIANRFVAAEWTLTPLAHELTGIDTDSPPPAQAVCIDICKFVDLDAGVLAELATDDIFSHGARVELDETSSFGRRALDVIAALSVQNDLPAVDLAAATGSSASTVRSKAAALARYGIVEMYKDGRAYHFHLRPEWRAILRRLWARLSRVARGLRRRRRHLEERLERVYTAYPLATSGALRVALSGLRAAWAARLAATNRMLETVNAERERILAALYA